MSNEKRMAQDYEILNATHIGQREIVFGYSPQNKDGMKYMTAYCDRNDLFALYTDALVSDNYPEIMEIFGNRVAEQAAKVKEEMAQETKEVLDNTPYDSTRCAVIPGCRIVNHKDDLNGKLVIIKPEKLRFEYQAATHQLMLCTGGFGASPNSRGTACFCHNLYSGKSTRYERSDVLATIEPKALPHWAKQKYNELVKGNRSVSKEER